MTKFRTIKGPSCLEEGMSHLSQVDPILAAAYEQTGPLPLRLKPDGFAELLSAIVSQQVSTASAAAIWARVDAAGLTSAQKVKTAGGEGLRAVGLSRPKIRYALALADAGIDYPALRNLPDQEVISTLTSVTGIGRWTADIYTMFSLRRADAFAAGDLALQEAARVLYGLPARPSEKDLRAMAEAWQPWRSVAARLLWSYYRLIKSREGVR